MERVGPQVRLGPPGQNSGISNITKSSSTVYYSGVSSCGVERLSRRFEKESPSADKKTDAAFLTSGSMESERNLAQITPLGMRLGVQGARHHKTRERAVPATACYSPPFPPTLRLSPAPSQPLPPPPLLLCMFPFIF